MAGNLPEFAGASNGANAAFGSFNAPNAAFAHLDL
jgi:hypothetical protein